MGHLAPEYNLPSYFSFHITQLSKVSSEVVLPKIKLGIEKSAFSLKAVWQPQCEDEPSGFTSSRGKRIAFWRLF